MFYGGVMGSFAVERFGTERLQAVTREEIEARFKLFREISAPGPQGGVGWQGEAGRWHGGARSLQKPVEDNPDEVRAATRQETLPIAMIAVLLAFVALLLCYSRGYMLLYGDAVAHLGNARRILDSRNPGLSQLGGVWLPLPHLLMLPFVQKMAWWQDGLAGAWPSLLCYVAGVAGFYRLARRLLVPRWAIVAAAFYALNPNLLYLSTHGDDRAAVSRAARLAHAADRWSASMPCARA